MQFTDFPQSKTFSLEIWFDRHCVMGHDRFSAATNLRALAKQHRRLKHNDHIKPFTHWSNYFGLDGFT
jgi:hypothetical protein